MKKIKALIPLLLLVVFGYCVPAAAEDAKNDAMIQWKADDTKGSAALTFVPTREMAENGATTLQITLKLTDVKGSTPEAAVVFDQANGEKWRVSDYTYDAGTGRLNLFLSDTKPLFEEGGSYAVGTVSVGAAGADYQISIQPVAVKTADQSHKVTALTQEELQDMSVTLTKEDSSDKPDPDPNPDPTPDPTPDTNPVYTTATEVVNELNEGTSAQVIYRAGAETGVTEEDQKAVFAALKNKDKAVTFELTDAQGKVLYAYTFRGDRIDNETIAMDMKLTVGADNKNITKLMEKDAVNLILKFAHSGTLPGTAEVKVYVGDTFKDGQKLYLYYYNPDTKKVEPVQKNIVVVEGYAVFELTHCSEYVLTTKEVKKAGEFPTPGDDTATGGKDSKNTGVLTGDRANYAVFVILILAAAAVIIAVVWYKRRHKNS